MDAYYYKFEETGADPIDKILGALICAGAYRTEYWNDYNTNSRDDYTGNTPIERIQNAASEAAAYIDILKGQLKEAQLRELAALGQAQEHYEALQAARNDALAEAVNLVQKIMADYAAEKGSTKTPMGRTAIFYGRKCKEAIRALQTKGD